MIDRITPRQFHKAVGVDDWRVLFGGACAYFRIGSFTTGVALVDVIGSLADTRATSRGRPAIRRSDGAADDARGRWAIAAGGHLVTDEHAPARWTLADAEGNEADVATWMGRE